MNSKFPSIDSLFKDQRFDQLMNPSFINEDFKSIAKYMFA